MEKKQKEELKHLTPAQIEHLLLSIPAKIEKQDVKYKEALEAKEDAKYYWEFQQAAARMKYESKDKKVDFIKAEIMRDEDVQEARKEYASQAAKYESEKLEKDRYEKQLAVLQSLIKLRALEYDRAGRQ